MESFVEIRMPRKSHSSIRNAAIASLSSFLFLKIWSTVFVQIGTLIPHPIGDVSYEMMRQIAVIENQGWFNRVFVAPWLRFDTVYYVQIAKTGYSDVVLSAWPPGYPLLIRGISSLGIFPLAGGLIVSNLAWIGAAGVLYYFLSQINDQFANRVILLMTVFPTGFFLVAAYTESLFILLSLITLILIYRKNWLLAGIFGALSTLVRFQGGLLVLVLLIEGISWIWLKQEDWLKRTGIIVLSCLIILVTFLIYILFLHQSLHYPWPWQVITSHWEQHIGWPWEGIIGNILYLTGVKEPPPHFNSIAGTTDLVTIILMCSCMFAARKQKNILPVSLQVYSWVSILVIICRVDNRSQLMSISRYLLDIFPVFFAQAAVLTKKKGLLTWSAFSLVVQSILVVCFSWWIFVG